MEFGELIKNKSVVFVGASPNLLGLDQGKFIDSFDVVVRTNDLPTILKNYEKDYGTKTDIVYFNYQYHEKNKPLDAKFYKDIGVKYLCFKRIASSLVEEYSKFVNCRRTPLGLGFLRSIVKNPLAGVIILRDLLSFKPKNIYVTGIDFFLKEKSYLLGYTTSLYPNSENIKSAKGHDRKTNTEYIYNLWKENKIEMPDFIKEIMLEIVNGNGKIN